MQDTGEDKYHKSNLTTKNILFYIWLFVTITVLILVFLLLRNAIIIRQNQLHPDTQHIIIDHQEKEIQKGEPPIFKSKPSHSSHSHESQKANKYKSLTPEVPKSNKYKSLTPEADDDIIFKSAEIQPGAALLNTFSTTIFKAINNNNNIIYSPLSISTCLAMVALGAKGATEVQLLNLLLSSNDNNNENINDKRNILHKNYPFLLNSLQQNDGRVPTSKFIFKISNKIFPANDFTVFPSFASSLESLYSSSVKQLNYHHEDESRNIINNWVSGNTNELIKEIIPPSTPISSSRMILVNTIYFKSHWMVPFQERLTITKTFYNYDGTNNDKVKFMTHEDMYASFYKAQDGTKILILPYYKMNFRMLLVLPPPGTHLDLIESQLKTENIPYWTSLTTLEHVRVEIPKFSSSLSIDLVSYLRKLGVTLPFDCNNADFSGMEEGHTSKLCISSILHKAKIDIDEHGTEAAAATATVMYGTGFTQPIRPKSSFIADHNFLYILYEHDTFSPIFMGKVVKL